MRKLLKFSVLLLAVSLILGLAGCDDGGGGGSKYDEYYKGSFRDNGNGSVEVVNNTAYDMLLFSGATISLNNIIGGVRAYNSNTVNFSTESDYQVGSYKVIHAVKESEFDKNGQNSRLDHSAMVTYRDGAKYRTNIVSTTDGAYQYIVNNKNTQYALELRKNGPDGEKVAYLTRAEQRRVINSPSNTQMTLFPVWIAFNNVTKTIVSFSPSDAGDTWEGQRDVTPRSPNDSQGQSPYNFPDSDIDIAFDNVLFPFATVNVKNLASRDIDFRNANAIITAQSDYTSIPSGFSDSYEITGGDANPLDLNVRLQNGSIVVPVRYKDDPSASAIAAKNGYEYTVTVTIKQGFNGSEAGHYEAVLVEVGEIKKADLLTSG